MADNDEYRERRSDDEAQLWEPTEQAVPPVIGRLDPDTGRPSLRYDTWGEVSEEDASASSAVTEYESDDGVNIIISF